MDVLVDVGANTLHGKINCKRGLSYKYTRWSKRHAKEVLISTLYCAKLELYSQSNNVVSYLKYFDKISRLRQLCHWRDEKNLLGNNSWLRRTQAIGVA
jgi:hypothetical protein